jgi:hypothetical protein
VGDWWGEFQDASAEDRERMLLPPEKGSGTGRKRRRRRRSKGTEGEGGGGAAPVDLAADPES